MHVCVRVCSFKIPLARLFPSTVVCVHCSVWPGHLPCFSQAFSLLFFLSCVLLLLLLLFCLSSGLFFIFLYFFRAFNALSKKDISSIHTMYICLYIYTKWSGSLIRSLFFPRSILQFWCRSSDLWLSGPTKTCHDLEQTYHESVHFNVIRLHSDCQFWISVLSSTIASSSLSLSHSLSKTRCVCVFVVFFVIRISQYIAWPYFIHFQGVIRLYFTRSFILHKRRYKEDTWFLFEIKSSLVFIVEEKLYS